MSDPLGCDHIRELLPELALGILSGDELEEAHTHLAGCPHCTVELARFTRAADGLLRLAPPAEPSVDLAEHFAAPRKVGIERPKRNAPPTQSLFAAAAERAGATPSTHPLLVPTAQLPVVAPSPAAPGSTARLPRWRQVVALVAAAAVGVVAALLLTESDRRAGAEYRELLAVSQGQDISAVPLLSEAGAQVGTVFLYQGNPSWGYAALSTPPKEGQYVLSVVDRAGKAQEYGSRRLAPDARGYGFSLQIPVDSIAVIKVVGPGGTFTAVRPA